jgi:phospholipid N-methyltransferase
MMNPDFYPTPALLIEKMIEGITLSSLSSILEPSAGKGDICDFIKGRLSYHNDTKFDVIEIDEDLQKILTGKEYRLIGDDFLGFQTYKQYDLIIANFPFSRGDEHLQKALSLLEQNGGKLVCLVNAETIRNPFSSLRQVIKKKLEDLNAEITYLADEFKYAERQTEVEAALIKVEVEREHISILLDNLQKSFVPEIEEVQAQELVENNFIKQFISAFNMECQLGTNLINEYYSLLPYIKNRIVKPNQQDYSSSIIELKVGKYPNNRKSKTINDYLEDVRYKYWECLISDERFSSRYTSNILKELNQKLQELRNYDFSLFNIRELEKTLCQSINEGIEESIMSMFDEFSRQFSYYADCQNNIHYYNGWKTNKAHKINSKIILPINGFSSYSYGGKKKIDDYYIRERLSDMVKVFNYLSEEQIDVRRLVGNSIEQANAWEKFSNIDLRYFTLTFYKKGTCHIKFTNQKLLDKFNIYGSKKKGWLPPYYGKVAYEDMDSEGKSVIDEFQGKEKYEEVCKNSEYYLVEDTVKLQLME